LKREDEAAGSQTWAVQLAATDTADHHLLLTATQAHEDAVEMLRHAVLAERDRLKVIVCDMKDEEKMYLEK
jgi:hypothetical protein